MIYMCRDCNREIENLRTEGDDVCYLFRCPDCADRTESEVKKRASELAKTLHTRYHAR